MLKLEVEKSRFFFNMKQRKKRGYKPSDEVEKDDVAKWLYPKANKHSRSVCMKKVYLGVIKKPDMAWIKILCEKLEVDPSFLFGFPSVHDKEYNRLKNNFLLNLEKFDLEKELLGNDLKDVVNPYQKDIVLYQSL